MAIDKIRPSLSKEVMNSYEDFLKRFESNEKERLTYMG